jgi:hypothetical protein
MLFGFWLPVPAHPGSQKRAFEAPVGECPPVPSAHASLDADQDGPASALLIVVAAVLLTMPELGGAQWRLGVALAGLIN